MISGSTASAAGRNRRTGWKERTFWKLLSHPFVQVVSCVLIAAVALQMLPHPQSNLKPSEHKSVSELMIDLVRPLGQCFPTLMGFWRVHLPQGIIVPTFPTAEEIRQEAQSLVPLVNDLADSKFFRIFKVDLGRECPFWARADLCSSPTGSCSVCECTDDQIPLPWKEKPIEHFVDRRFYEKEEISPWIDPRNTGMGLPGPAGIAETSFLDLLSGQETDRSTYVDLSLNPPGFTSYRGRNIWSLIYKENCIRDVPAKQLSPSADEAVCTEEEMFERMISGLQTTIMTLASEYNKPFEWNIALPLTAKSRGASATVTGGKQLSPRHRYDLDLFRWRVAGHRDWIENLYLDFSILVQTLAKVRGVVESCPCYTGMEVEDSKTKDRLVRLLDVVDTLPSASITRANQTLFKRKHELALQQFTNISRIFDCIECEKCRLHGKVKLAALQVALKAASGGSEVPPLRSLERNEITALVNALRYFGEAVLIVSRMKRRVKALRAIAAVTVTALVTGTLMYWQARLRPEAGQKGASEQIPLGELVHELELEERKKKRSVRRRN